MHELLTSGLLFALAWHCAAAAGIVGNLVATRPLRRVPTGLLVIAVPVATLLFSGATSLALSAGLVASGLAAVLAARVLRDYTVEGVHLLTSYAALLVTGVPWSTGFIATMPVSGVTRALLLAGLPAVTVMLPITVVTRLEAWEVLCRRRWSRPRLADGAALAGHGAPMVSIHVPCHAEPPDLVNATLDRLAALDYPNYEVVVIDNNTTDTALWHPVRDHCARLGRRFRFVHVEGLTGAKAGALNLVMRDHIDPAAQLLAVVDADYHVHPDFLRRLVGHFDDPKIGFVQTPHDYRDWRASRYLRWCYWEYKFFFETTMVTLNERDAALTVGTMCIIRRSALEEAGGWAEWCLTEDSELAIRIHAAGYSSVYTTESFGHGLIPETFDGSKKQRHRWTAGPIQELKHHGRMFADRSVPLTPLQRLHHLNHGLDRAQIGVSLAMLPLGIAAALSMLWHGENVTVPAVLWAAATAVAVANLALKWVTYTRAVGCSTRDAIGASIASSALKHTILMAAGKALVTRHMPWRRTDKFTPTSTGLKALLSTRTETLLAVLLVGGGITMATNVEGPGVLLMVGIGMMGSGLGYVSAPVMALLAERDIAAQLQEATEHLPAATSTFELPDLQPELEMV